MGKSHFKPKVLPSSGCFLPTQPLQVLTCCCFSSLLPIWRLLQAESQQGVLRRPWPPSTPAPWVTCLPALSSRPRFPPGIPSPLRDHPTAHCHLSPGPRRPGNRPNAVPPPRCCRGCPCRGPRRRGAGQQRVRDGAAHPAAEETPTESHHLHGAAAHGPGEEIPEAEVLVHPRQVRGCPAGEGLEKGDSFCSCHATPGHKDSDMQDTGGRVWSLAHIFSALVEQ